MSETNSFVGLDCADLQFARAGAEVLRARGEISESEYDKALSQIKEAREVALDLDGRFSAQQSNTTRNMSNPENPEAPRPTLVELLQDQVEILKEALRKSEEYNEHLRVSRVETDRDLPPIARTEANLWKAKFFVAAAELTKANKGIRRLRESRERLQTRVTLLQERIEFAEQALGNHPDSNTDLAAEITRLRDENRDWFHKYTKRVTGLSSVTLASIGKEHFGNPIPQEWYTAAKVLLQILAVPYPPDHAPTEKPTD